MIRAAILGSLAILMFAAAAPVTSLIPTARPAEKQAQPDVVKLIPWLKSSLRPKSRPSKPKTVKVTNSGKIVTSKGFVCGVEAIKGVAIDTIQGKLPGCGIERPVKIQSVSDVLLSHSATLNCKTAKVFNSWVKDSLIPIVGKRGGGVQSINVVAHYSCRTRNNQPNAKMSEHSFGNAIDIAGFELKDGTQVTLIDGWTLPSHRNMLRRLHKSACGPFGTVLGPEANRFHLDHFHFDTAKRRSSAYCR